MSFKNRFRVKLFLALFCAVVLLVGLVALLAWSEGAFKSVSSFWQIVENSVIILMGEYPDKPTTAAGRVLQLILLVFGTLVFGTIVGKVSSLFVTSALNKEKKMKNYKDHIVICNWNSKAAGIIRQMLQADTETTPDIVVVSTSDVQNCEEFSDSDSESLYFVKDDPTHHATLKRLGASRSKAVILLADEEMEAPDEKNALIALAVKHLEHDENKKKDIHVVAELMNPDRERHLQEAGVDEVISARDYSSGIIAQSAFFANMSTVYQRLLTYSGDSNEMYFIKPGNYPASFVGASFAELGHKISERNTSYPESPLLLLGVKRSDGSILLNPQQKQFGQLKQDDTLIVMAFQHVEEI